MVAAKGIPVWLMEEESVSPAQAEERWGIDPKTLGRWFAKGLEGYKLGNKRFTTVPALARYGQLISAAAEEPPADRSKRSAKKDQDEAAELLGG